jgi:hypothetical protein
MIMGCVTKCLDPSPANEREEVKSELIDDYAGDTLPADDRRRFELYFTHFAVIHP